MQNGLDICRIMLIIIISMCSCLNLFYWTVLKVLQLIFKASKITEKKYELSLCLQLKSLHLLFRTQCERNTVTNYIFISFKPFSAMKKIKSLCIFILSEGYCVQRIRSSEAQCFQFQYSNSWLVVGGHRHALLQDSFSFQSLPSDNPLQLMEKQVLKWSA